MKLLKAFAQFWYDFIVGDDWKIAVAVVLALAVVFAVMSAKLLGDHALTILGGVVVVAFFSVSLIIDVHSQSKQ